jgi:hypothetical protein
MGLRNTSSTVFEPIVEGGTPLAQRHIFHSDMLDELRETGSVSARSTPREITFDSKG